MPARPTGDPGRAAARTAVVWDAVFETVEVLATAHPVRSLRVIDLGGGTGGLAVRIAELGHQVLVVEPSPDALASLRRRAVESGVEDHVFGVQGDASELRTHVGDELADMVLCHGVLEVVDDPSQALAATAAVVRGGGFLSVVVSGRLSTVIGRALAGDTARARAMLDISLQDWDLRVDGPRRFSREEIIELVTPHGFAIDRVDAVRVFTDLVPSALVDAEPGARQGLLDLERAVAGRPEFSALAGQHHLVARRTPPHP